MYRNHYMDKAKKDLAGLLRPYNGIDDMLAN